MSEYVAPLKDMQFVLQEIAPLDELSALPGLEEVNHDLATAILDEAGKFANGVLSPLNVVGDREGCQWSEDTVRTATGWRAAYRHFTEGGWNALSCLVECHALQLKMPRLDASPFFAWQHPHACMRDRRQLS